MATLISPRRLVNARPSRSRRPKSAPHLAAPVSQPEPFAHLLAGAADITPAQEQILAEGAASTTPSETAISQVYEVLMFEQYETTSIALITVVHRCDDLHEAKGYADKFNEDELVGPPVHAWAAVRKASGPTVAVLDDEGQPLFRLADVDSGSRL